MSTQPQIEPQTEPMIGTGMPSRLALIGVITRREIMVRLRDKTFLYSTLFLLVLVAVSVTVPMLLARSDERPAISVVAVGDLAGRVAQQAARTGTAAKVDDPSGIPAATITVRTAPDDSAAEALVRAGTVDAALLTSADGTDATLVGQEEVSDGLTELVTRSLAAQRLAGQFDPAGVASALDHQPGQRLLDPPPKDRDLGIFLGFAFAGLFTITTLVFGLNIAQSVVEEKQSRVVELLVAAVPVRLLLIGKVLGSSVLALGQLTLLLAVGLAGASAAGQSGVVGLLLNSSGWFVVFFLVGFAMLGCLWAAAGAVASRQEDLQSTTLPMQAVVMLPFLVTSYVIKGPWLVILSYVPFTSTVMMPRRLVAGQAAWWEPVLSAGIGLAVCAGLVLVGARLYQNSLLRGGGRVSWRTAWSGKS
jgi:ABC-2 type transport system permease protein